MLPLSVSFVTPIKKQSSYSISNSGIILQIDTKEWLPLKSDKDKSIMLDTYSHYVLLYCPVG